MECMLSKLDLFSSPPIQSSILRTEKVSYNPITSLDNTGSIEFHIPSNADSYRDLSSIQLLLTVKIIDNSVLPANQCTVYFNNTLVSHDDMNYHYKCFFETILNYGRDAADTHLKNVGWFLDEGDDIDSIRLDEDNRYTLLKKRNVFGTSEGADATYNNVQLIGRLNIDVANLQKLLPSGIDIRISLVKENPSFYMLAANENSACDIKILEANLSINHIHLNPDILLAHHKVLSTKNAIFPYKRTTVRQFTINNGSYNLCLDNIVIGQLPNILLFCMVPNSSYSGNYRRNPFNFKHYLLQTFSVYVNGNQITGRPLTFEHNENGNSVLTRGYETLFSGTGINFADRGHLVSPELYKESLFLLMFDLTADHSNNSDCVNIFNEGTIRIEGTFKEALAEPVTCLLYFEFDALMEIDANKNIIIS
uniref:CSON011154 protein n=1 Tax=Culicoides sonorensis TaxID=179676 RepID=A0A336M720_CULSO